MIDLRHLLEESGHSPFYAEKSLLELGMDATRVSRFVKRSDAEAWVILAGSHEVLNWFSTHDTPAIALFGRHQSVSIASAGPDKVPPLRRLTQRLVDLGHRRITLLIRHHLRHPEPAPTARAFIEELEARDIHVGEFNLPDWDETSAGFQEILRSLFALTPPTAVITDEAFLFIAAHQFMAKRGIRVPEDVSLICTDSDPAFDWCEPSVAHIRWDSRPVVRRIVRWAEITSHGTDDRRKISTKAEFIDGGTLGPAR
jgi:DNA-binding LacI/PurR family transcriptional regulator